MSTFRILLAQKTSLRPGSHCVCLRSPFLASLQPLPVVIVIDGRRRFLLFHEVLHRKRTVMPAGMEKNSVFFSSKRLPMKKTAVIFGHLFSSVSLALLHPVSESRAIQKFSRERLYRRYSPIMLFSLPCSVDFTLSVLES